MDQIQNSKENRIAEEDFGKSLIWDTVVTAGLALLFSAVPFLAVPPISWFVTWTVTIFSNILYDKVKHIPGWIEAFVETELGHRAFDDASVKLKLIARAKGPDSKEYKDARKIQTDRLREFVSLKP